MEAKKLARITKALANERRIMIIRYIATARTAPVWRISQKINLSGKATSKHLLILEAAKILTREQEGLEVFYRLHRPLYPVVKACIT